MDWFVQDVQTQALIQGKGLASRTPLGEIPPQNDMTFIVATLGRGEAN